MDFIEQISSFFTTLSVVQVSVGIAITSAIVSIVIEWRLAMISMFAQYLFISLLLNSELPNGLGLIGLVAGFVACFMLYLTARRVEQALGTIPDGRAWLANNQVIYPMGLPFRFLALLFVMLVLLPLPERLTFMPFPTPFIVSTIWLLAMGLLTIILTRDPIKTGIGLLVFQNGFDLLYALAEPGLVVLGLLSSGTILVGLVASYLAISRYLPLIEARQAVQETMDPESPEAVAMTTAAFEEVLALPGYVEPVLIEEEEEEEGDHV